MKITNPHHQYLLSQFIVHKNIVPNNAWVKHYLGTDKILYALKTDDKKKIIKDYLKMLNLDIKNFTDLVLSLSKGESFEEVSCIGKITESYPKLRQQLSISTVDKLFDHVKGWAEVDSNCTFSADDLLSNWSEWKKLLDKFVDDPNVHKRRASVVLLCLPTRKSPDLRFYELAFSYVDKLMPEKDILITKAISWILRSMTKHHPEMVYDYLEKNKLLLPKIAVRETTRKLETGRK